MSATTTEPRRKLMPVTVLARLRNRHQQIFDTLRVGNRTGSNELVAYMNDVQALITAYEAATDRLRAAQRALDGER